MAYVTNLEYKFFKRKNIGVIGCGSRSCDMLETLQTLSMNTKLVAIHDICPEESLKRLRDIGEDISELRVWEDVDDMLDNAGLDGVIIGTRSEEHVFYAKKVLKRNIPMILEKPITFSMDELTELREAYEKSEKKVIVSFPLRETPIINLARELIDEGRIGTPEHVDAYNYIPYGGVYFHNWYCKTGPAGLFFEKSTHDFDWINRLVGLKPTEIFAMTSHRIFGGDKPSGKSCTDCELQLTCMESPFMQKNFVYDNPQGTSCAFAEDVKTYDSAGVLIRYESGMHANYAENHFARKGAQLRGGRISGYSGTLEFDFYTNILKVYRHHRSIAETYSIEESTPHFGGDKAILFDFVKMMNGTNDTTCTMEAGFISTLMCMAARKSIGEKALVPIIWGDGRAL